MDAKHTIGVCLRCNPLWPSMVAICGLPCLQAHRPVAVNECRGWRAADALKALDKVRRATSSRLIIGCSGCGRGWWPNRLIDVRSWRRGCPARRFERQLARAESVRLVRAKTYHTHHRPQSITHDLISAGHLYFLIDLQACL